MNNKERFLKYLQTCVKSTRATESNPLFLGGNAPKDYVRFLESDRLFDYNRNKWGHVGSMYDINDYEKALEVFNDLIADEDFLQRDKDDNQGWRRGAISHYVCFLSAQDFFCKAKDTKPTHSSKNFSYFPLQRIFYGAPGTGKSYSVFSAIAIHLGIINEKEKLSDAQRKGLENANYIFRTTFHPDYDYAQFVGCYKPKKEDDKITYEFVPQVFTNALVKSYENSDESVYLVIEEINRGNCAQIFGDIFQLLDRNANGESEYAINVDEDLKKYLQDYFSGSEKIDEEYKRLIDDGKIKLPRNFNIIATMNTSDQSLFPMDSAFKRRWDWEYVKVDYKNEVSGKYTIKVDDKTYNWHTFLKAVNDRIKAVTSSEDKQMGNFFIKGDVDAKAFCNKVMFYLWNDISKDYYESNDSLFQTDKPVKDRKNNHFSFNELFGVDQTELLKGFMKFIGCDPVPNKPMESETNKEEDSSEN